MGTGNLNVGSGSSSAACNAAFNVGAPCLRSTAARSPVPPSHCGMGVNPPPGRVGNSWNPPAVTEGVRVGIDIDRAKATGSLASRSERLLRTSLNVVVFGSGLRNAAWSSSFKLFSGCPAGCLEMNVIPRLVFSCSSLKLRSSCVSPSINPRASGSCPNRPGSNS